MVNTNINILQSSVTLNHNKQHMFHIESEYCFLLTRHMVEDNSVM